MKNICCLTEMTNKAIFKNIPFIAAIFVYYYLIYLYYFDYISGFSVFCALFFMAVLNIVFIIINRRLPVFRRALMCSSVLSIFLLIYEAPSVVLDDYRFLVTSYNPPEEIIKRTEIYTLSVFVEYIGNFKTEQELQEYYSQSNKDFYNITPITNATRYSSKNKSIYKWLGVYKTEVNQMSANVDKFLRANEIIKSEHIDEFLSRDKLGGSSAGLALILTNMMEGGLINNNVAIAVTGAIDKNGTVEKVGYIEEKLLIVDESGLSYIIIPKPNLSEARKIKWKYDLGIEIIGVSNVDDAITQIIWINNNQD